MALPPDPDNYCRYSVPRAKLLDGRDVSGHSEEWRHECEARAILNMPGQFVRRRHLERIELRRGWEERRRLEATILALYDALTVAA